jgi:hypothetical protein
MVFDGATLSARMRKSSAHYLELREAGYNFEDFLAMCFVEDCRSGRRRNASVVRHCRTKCAGCKIGRADHQPKPATIRLARQHITSLARDTQAVLIRLRSSQQLTLTYAH